MSQFFLITNARIVTPERDFVGTVVVEDGRIAEVLAERHYPEGLDAAGRWLIPGVIDLHSDYLEKEVAPRPGAEFPLELAFHFMDRRALASGVTTVLGAVRVSADKQSKGSTWKRDGIELGRQYEALAQTAKGRHLMHVRWDTNFAPAEDQVEALKQFSTLGNIVYNENIPGQRQFRDMEALASKHARLHDIDIDQARAKLEEQIRMNSAINNRPLIRDAFAGRVPLGSHDDTTVEHVREARAMGCTLCEMPTTMAAAQQAKALDMQVIMGAPNYYRGGSHCGNLSCAEALDAGVVDVLCSDYHFPSMLGSVVRMFAAGIPPHEAVKLVTRNAARALGRDAELGSIEPGKLADLTLFSDRGSYAEVSHTWVGGRLVYQG